MKATSSTTEDLMQRQTSRLETSSPNSSLCICVGYQRPCFFLASMDLATHGGFRADINQSLRCITVLSSVELCLSDGPPSALAMVVTSIW